MRGGGVVYQEFIHVGKGRDMGFNAVNGFEQKVKPCCPSSQYVSDVQRLVKRCPNALQISSGNSLQCTSRELYRLGKYLDLPRLMSFYFTSAGFFITSKMMTVTIKMMLFCYLVVALLRSERVITCCLT